MNKNIKIIIIVAILLVVGFFGYSYFFVGKTNDQSIGGLTKTNVSGSSGSAEQAFVSQIATVDSINLKDDVSNDPIFLSLVDSSRELVPITPGRNNPFAPLTSIGTVVTSAATLNATTSTKTATTTKKK